MKMIFYLFGFLQANAAYLCKRFDELGILEVKKDYDTTTK